MALMSGEMSNLAGLLKQELGSAVVLDRYHIAKERDDYVVLLAQLVHPDLKVVIKLAGRDATIECPFERTAWVHKLVRARCAVPVAEVIAADVSYSRWPWRYMIKEYIPGVEWATLQTQLRDEEARELYIQVARAVAEMH